MEKINGRNVTEKHIEVMQEYKLEECISACSLFVGHYGEKTYVYDLREYLLKILDLHPYPRYRSDDIIEFELSIHFHNLLCDIVECNKLYIDIVGKTKKDIKNPLEKYV